MIGRKTHLASIGALGTVPAYRFLLKSYRSESEPEVKAAAVAAMGYLEFRPYAKEVFRIAAKTRHPEILAAALKALHGMDATGRAEVYRQVLATSGHDPVLAAAADALAATRDPDRFRFLLELAGTRPRRAFHAYRAGTRYRALPPPSFAVRAAAAAKDPRLRALALKDAVHLGLPEAVDLAHHAADLARYDEALRLAVIEVLGAAGRPADVRALLPLSMGTSPAARGRLTDLLRLVRDRGSVALLVRALEAESVATRRLAADVLARIEGEEVAVAIAARIAREEDPDTLAALVRAAGWHRSQAAAAAIVQAARRKAGAAALTDAAVEALARIGLGLESVRAYFTGLAASLEWQERVTALDAIAADPHPAAVGLMLKGLADPVWQVRLAAIQGLARSRVRAAIGPLIGRLEAAEPARIRRAAGLALFRITGQQFFESADLWRAWWSEHHEAFRIPPEPPGSGEDGGRTVATFYGIPVDSDRVIFVIDQSGSMAGDRGVGRRKGPSELKRAVEETVKVVERLPHGARANVILFESTVHPWKADLIDMKPARRQALARFLRSRRARGGTNLFDALEMALETDEVDTVYLLSDGEPTAGRLTRDEDILREVRRVNRTRRIAIHTVALGHESALLRELAAQNAGTHTQR